MVKMVKIVANGQNSDITWPATDQPFSKKSLFFWDTRDNQEYDAKNRLLIPGPSPEKLMAEIDRLKENWPKL